MKLSDFEAVSAARKYFQRDSDSGKLVRDYLRGKGNSGPVEVRIGGQSLACEYGDEPTDLAAWVRAERKILEALDEYFTSAATKLTAELKGLGVIVNDTLEP